MALDLGLGVTPWSPLAGGVLAGKYSEADLTKPTGPAKPSGTRKDILLNMNRLTLNSLQIANVVKDVAKDIGRTPSQVALAWLLHQPGTTSIIIGARTLEQLIDNLGCLDAPLSSEQLARLNECSRIELGFPHDFLRSDMVQFVVTGGAQIVQS
jgi:aryl-alcohol dehydrogenase-like predicted oxidoreductase